MPAASAPIAFSPVVGNEIARYRSTRVIPYACRVEKLPIRQVHAVRTHHAREHGHAALELALISERMVPRRYPQVREQQHDLGGLAQELGTRRAVRHPLAYHRLDIAVSDLEGVRELPRQKAGFARDPRRSTPSPASSPSTTRRGLHGSSNAT